MINARVIDQIPKLADLKIMTIDSSFYSDSLGYGYVDTIPSSNSGYPAGEVYIYIHFIIIICLPIMLLLFFFLKYSNIIVTRV